MSDRSTTSDAAQCATEEEPAVGGSEARDSTCWPDELAQFWIDGAEVTGADRSRDVRAGRDSLGIVGRIGTSTALGSLAVAGTRSGVVGRLRETGLDVLREVQGESELHRAPEELSVVDVDPFLIEDSVHAVVRGRDFPGRQRELLERKLARLESEIDDPETDEERRTAAARMRDAMLGGLESSVDVVSVERRFTPDVSVPDAVESFGDVVSVREGTRIVYDVRAVDPEDAPDEEAEPMVFTVVALGRREVVVLFTGGLHGLRHLTALEHGDQHAAWFANRERTKTDACAPWVSRRVLAELRERGTSRLLVHPRRDQQAIELTVTERGTRSLRVGDSDAEVPVIRARTAEDDELVILDDAENPLVLRLVERGAELERTILSVLPALNAGE